MIGKAHHYIYQKQKKLRFFFLWLKNSKILLGYTTIGKFGVHVKNKKNV